MSRSLPGKQYFGDSWRPILGVPGAVLLGLAAGCEGSSAEVSGTANGIAFGESSWVFWGARYVVVSAVEMECSDLHWVEQNYDTTSGAPSEFDTSIVQFTFAGELIETGKFTIAQGASVQATVVNIDAGVFHEMNATAGTFDLESVEDEGFATGSFEAVTFEDGSLDGTFNAEWCRTLKP